MPVQPSMTYPQNVNRAFPLLSRLGICLNLPVAASPGASFRGTVQTMLDALTPTLSIAIDANSVARFVIQNRTDATLEFKTQTQGVGEYGLAIPSGELGFYEIANFMDANSDIESLLYICNYTSGAVVVMCWLDNNNIPSVGGM